MRKAISFSFFFVLVSVLLFTSAFAESTTQAEKYAFNVGRKIQNQLLVPNSINVLDCSVFFAENMNFDEGESELCEFYTCPVLARAFVILYYSATNRGGGVSDYKTVSVVDDSSTTVFYYDEKVFSNINAIYTLIDARDERIPEDATPSERDSSLLKFFQTASNMDVDQFNRDGDFIRASGDSSFPIMPSGNEVFEQMCYGHFLNHTHTNEEIAVAVDARKLTSQLLE